MHLCEQYFENWIPLERHLLVRVQPGTCGPICKVIVALADTLGRRVRSEVLPLQRRHVDLEAGTVRLMLGPPRIGRAGWPSCR